MAYSCVAIISPLDPSTGSRVTIRVASANDRRVTGLNSLTWEPAITSPPVLSITLFNGDFIAAVDAGEAKLPLAMETIKKTWPAADTYIWTGAPVEIYAEEIGTAWPWTKRFAGRVTSLARDAQKLSLTAKVDQEALSANVLTATYAGTGGAEGGLDLKGKVKPLLIGRAQNVQPVLIDADNSVYQFSGYGPIEAVATLYERGSDFYSGVGDYASYALLVAATIPPGSWGTCLAQGMVRLGAPQYGVITGDVWGHKIGSATPRLTGAVIQALATIAGVSGTYIDSASLSAMDTAVPYPINFALEEQATFADAARRLALPCGYQSGIGLTGLYFVTKADLSATPALTMNARGSTSPQVAVSSEAEVSPPYYKTIMGAARSWRVHSADEISFTATIVPKGAWSNTTTYREGNEVSQPDGSTYIYINTTASSGHAPPTPPTTSNTWWAQTNPPLMADGIRYTDGTPIQSLQPAQAGADVTASAQVVSVVSPTTQGIAADYTGAITGVLSDIVWSPIVTLGGTSKKIDNLTTYAVSNQSGGTFSVDNTTSSTTKGNLTISAMTANTATCDLAISYNGAQVGKFSITLTKILSAPPSTGGTPGKTVSWTTGDFTGINTTTYTAIVALKTLTLATGESLYGTGTLDYIVSGNGSATRTMSLKWQYSVAGANSWNDFPSSPITGSTATSRYSSGAPDWEVIDPDPGHVAMTQTNSLAAGSYDVRLVAVCSTTGRTCTVSGTASVQAKV